MQGVELLNPVVCQPEVRDRSAALVQLKTEDVTKVAARAAWTASREYGFSSIGAIGTQVTVIRADGDDRRFEEWWKEWVK